MKSGGSDRGAEAEIVRVEAKVAGVPTADNLAGGRDQMADGQTAVDQMADGQTVVDQTVDGQMADGQEEDDQMLGGQMVDGLEEDGKTIDSIGPPSQAGLPAPGSRDDPASMFRLDSPRSLTA